MPSLIIFTFVWAGRYQNCIVEHIKKCNIILQLFVINYTAKEKKYLLNKLLINNYYNIMLGGYLSNNS